MDEKIVCGVCKKLIYKKKERIGDKWYHPFCWHTALGRKIPLIYDNCKSSRMR